MENEITVKAAHTQEAVINGQCDVVETFDTIKEAKAFAKKTLTDAFQSLNEMSQPLRYAQVCVDGECRADYFRK